MNREASIGAVAATIVALGVSEGAQVRPGAKVERTYGVGLPRDIETLVITDFGARCTC